MNFLALAENLGLDEDEFMELADLFIETSISDLAKLEAAAQQQDIEETLKASHSIKGAAGNLGFLNIFEIAKTIEHNARSNSLEGASESVEAIREKIQELSEEVEKQN